MHYTDFFLPFWVDSGLKHFLSPEKKTQKIIPFYEDMHIFNPFKHWSKSMT